MTLQEALGILDLKPGDSSDVVKSKYRTLAKQYHQDKSGDVNSHDMMVKINAAYELISDKYLGTGRIETDKARDPRFDDAFNGMPRQEYRKTKDMPPWQTDKRSSNNNVGKDFRNVNFCMKSIYDVR